MGAMVAETELMNTEAFVNEELEEKDTSQSEEFDTETSVEKESEVIVATEEAVEYITFVAESHTPSNISTQVGIEGWRTDEDFDIAGQTYSGGLKISIYDMFSALDGNNSTISNEITSEIHYALNIEKIKELEKESQYFVGKFVICKDTDGSPSTAVISILLDDEEVYNSGEIDCFSLDIEPFNIELTDRSERVIRIVCQHKGNPLVIGMVNCE